MTPEFVSRMIGMVFFTIVGARLGADSAPIFDLHRDSGAVILGLTGMLVGLILTPWFTVRPVRALRRIVNEMPIERLVMSLVGALLGLLLALLAAYPLSLLTPPFGSLLPAALTLLCGYIGMTIFALRTREIVDLVRKWLGLTPTPGAALSSRKLILDTSVLIDGRIIDIADTGFLGGTLIVPTFVLNELHRVADSADPLRRNRGRRGLTLLNRLQQNELIPVRIVEDDFEDITEVDGKLVALALQMSAALVTNDYNLNQVADAQGVPVLNINRLANAVRSIYIPGETFAIRIIQEGRDPDQGVGYLEDGTMVVVENGKDYIDRSIPVTVTKLLNRETGRIIFAVPEAEAQRAS